MKISTLLFFISTLLPLVAQCSSLVTRFLIPDYVSQPKGFKMPKGPCRYPPLIYDDATDTSATDTSKNKAPVLYDSGYNQRVTDPETLNDVFRARWLTLDDGWTYCSITYCIPKWKFWNPRKMPQNYACCRSEMGRVYCRNILTPRNGRPLGYKKPKRPLGGLIGPPEALRLLMRRQGKGLQVEIKAEKEIDIGSRGKSS